MSKFKDMIIEMIEQHRDGHTIAQISSFTGLPQDVVFDILKRYGMEDDFIYEQVH